MSIIVKGSGGSSGEDLTSVLAEQAVLIQEIEESLVGKTTGANITPETVLVGYRGYKGKELVEGLYNVENLTPENVRDGKSFGVGLIGTMIEGLIPQMFGCSKLAIDKVTFSSRTVISSDVLRHSLGENPKFAILLSNIGRTAVANDIIAGLAVNPSGATVCNTSMFSWNSSKAVSVSNSAYMTSNATHIFSKGGNIYCTAGVEYTIITGA